MKKNKYRCPVCGNNTCIAIGEGFNRVCPRCGFSSEGKFRTEEKANENFAEMSKLFNHVLKKLFYANIKAIDVPRLNFLLNATLEELTFSTFADSERYAQLADFIREVYSGGEKWSVNV